MARIKRIYIRVSHNLKVELDPEKHVIRSGDRILRIYNPLLGGWVPYRAIAHMIETQ